MLIYKITNLINDKIYIGKTTTTLKKRWELHLIHAFKEKRKTYFCNALRKNGSEHFNCEILIDNILTEDKLNEYEIIAIADNNSTNRLIGYNLLPGGTGGFTDEMRRKSVETRKANGWCLSQEHINALQLGRKKAGYKKKTYEEKRIISRSVRKYYEEHPEHYDKICKINKANAKSGKEHPMWGKTHTIASRQKISNARQGKTYEEIFGQTKAKELKENKKKLTGSKNPNYNNIDHKMLKLFSSNPRISRNELCELLDCSPPTAITRFKTLLKIDNLQKFRYNKSDAFLQEFFNKKLQEYEDVNI